MLDCEHTIRTHAPYSDPEKSAAHGKCGNGMTLRTVGETVEPVETVEKAKSSVQRGKSEHPAVDR